MASALAAALFLVYLAVLPIHQVHHLSESGPEKNKTQCTIRLSGERTSWLPTVAVTALPAETLEAAPCPLPAPAPRVPALTPFSPRAPPLLAS